MLTLDPLRCGGQSTTMMESSSSTLSSLSVPGMPGSYSPTPPPPDCCARSLHQRITDWQNAVRNNELWHVKLVRRTIELVTGGRGIVTRCHGCFFRRVNRLFYHLHCFLAIWGRLVSLPDSAVQQLANLVKLICQHFYVARVLGKVFFQAFDGLLQLADDVVKLQDVLLQHATSVRSESREAVRLRHGLAEVPHLPISNFELHQIRKLVISG